MRSRYQEPRIFISAADFGSVHPESRKILEDTGWRVTSNDSGRKLLPSEVAGLGADCDGILAGTEDLSELLQANTRLKIISRMGVGLDSVPLAACRKRGIQVSYTPGAMTHAVAEFTLGTMISISRGICAADRRLRKGLWSRPQGLHLGSAVIGLIGFGRIGSRVAELLRPLSPQKILACDVLDKGREISRLRDTGLSISAAKIDEVFQEADVVSVHVPLTPMTRHLVSAGRLSTMKKGSFLINTSRGDVVDEGGLFEALSSNHLAAAALDVFHEEPYRGRLTTLDNVLVTPHLASCSREARQKMELEAAKDLVRFFRDEPLLHPVPAHEYENQGVAP